MQDWAFTFHSAEITFSFGRRRHRIQCDSQTAASWTPASVRLMRNSRNCNNFHSLNFTKFGALRVLSLNFRSLLFTYLTNPNFTFFNTCPLHTVTFWYCCNRIGLGLVSTLVNIWPWSWPLCSRMHRWVINKYYSFICVSPSQKQLDYVNQEKITVHKCWDTTHVKILKITIQYT